MRIEGGAVVLEPDDVTEMIRSALWNAEISRRPIAVQIVVEQPFGAGMKVHNEVPTLRVLLSSEYGT